MTWKILVLILGCVAVTIESLSGTGPVLATSHPHHRRHHRCLMPRARRVCSTPGCPELTTQGRCTTHRREADRTRGTATQRGYNSRGHRHFRKTVLARDPICVLCHLKPSTAADHYPTSRRDLIEQGLNPNDPSRGRGLCKPCHDSETARHQPGGWHGG